MNLRAFSKKDGVPSTSSKASKIGLPRTSYFTVSLSFTIEEMKINHKKAKQAITFFLLNIIMKMHGLGQHYTDREKK